MPVTLSTNPAAATTQIAELVSMAYPVIETQIADPTVMPSGDSGGVSLGQSLTCAVSIGLRETVDQRTARIVFDPDTVDLTASCAWRWGSTTGTAAPSGSWADLDAFTAGIKADIDGSAATNVTVTLEDLDGDGVNEVVKLQSTDGLDYAVDGTVTAGSVTTYADAVSGTARVYGRIRDSGGNLPTDRPWHRAKRRGWRVLPVGDNGALMSDTVPSAGAIYTAIPVGAMEAVYPHVELTGVTGSPADGSGVVLDCSVCVIQGAPQGYVVS